MKAKHEVADIIHRFGRQYRQQYRPRVQVEKTLRALCQCRTAALGGHVQVCTACATEQIAYNSCRNRHCPRCQTTNKERWILDRESELLPVPYYHMVFTLPHELNALLPKHAKVVYNSLLKASWQTVKSFGEDPKYLGAKMGMVSILHTWGQQLWLHPHVHCIVPAGGVTPSGKWKAVRYGSKYLFPKKALSIVFRAKFMALLRQQLTVPQTIAQKLFDKPWVVYAKRPFATPKTVVEYLGRYTHKVAISNHRITSIGKQKVSFRYKDYHDGSTKKEAHISGVEFLRRFACHVLPHGFMRIRHYGILASRNKQKELNLAKEHFGEKRWEKQSYTWEQIAIERLGFNPNQCRHCQEECLITIRTIEPQRGPPSLGGTL